MLYCPQPFILHMSLPINTTRRIGDYIVPRCDSVEMWAYSSVVVRLWSYRDMQCVKLLITVWFCCFPICIKNYSLVLNPLKCLVLNLLIPKLVMWHQTNSIWSAICLNSCLNNRKNVPNFPMKNLDCASYRHIIISTPC